MSSGSPAGWCRTCDDRRFPDAAGIRDTDPHQVVHELIRRMTVIASELLEDLMDTEHGGLEAHDEPCRECALNANTAVVEALSDHAVFIRRALDLYVTPKVDAFVAEVTNCLNVCDTEDTDL